MEQAIAEMFVWIAQAVGMPGQAAAIFEVFLSLLFIAAAAILFKLIQVFNKRYAIDTKTIASHENNNISPLDTGLKSSLSLTNSTIANEDSPARGLYDPTSAYYNISDHH